MWLSRTNNGARGSTSSCDFGSRLATAYSLALATMARRVVLFYWPRSCHRLGRQASSCLTLSQTRLQTVMTLMQIVARQGQLNATGREVLNLIHALSSPLEFILHDGVA